MSFLLNLFLNRTKNVVVTFCGLDKAGKTTMVDYLKTGRFNQNTHTTMGMNKEIIEIPGITFNVMDLGGQEDFRCIWHEVNERTDVLIYVVDSSDFTRFAETKEIFHRIVENQIKDDVVVITLLNKADIIPRINGGSEFITRFGLSKLHHTWAIFETSSLTGQGIYEVFTWLSNRFKKK